MGRDDDFPLFCLSTKKGQAGKISLTNHEHSQFNQLRPRVLSCTAVLTQVGLIYILPWWLRYDKTGSHREMTAGCMVNEDKLYGPQKGGPGWQAIRRSLVQIPGFPRCILKYPWARYRTPNCSWWADGTLHGSLCHQSNGSHSSV